MDDPVLPDGAIGLDLGDIVIEFRQETRKLVVLHKATGYHYTLQAAPRSGIIDVHRTSRDPSGITRHQTVFAMLGARLLPVLHELEGLMREFLALVRPLRIGCLHHRHISIVRGLEPTTPAKIAAITRKRKKRLVLGSGPISRTRFPSGISGGDLGVAGYCVLALPSQPQDRPGPQGH